MTLTTAAAITFVSVSAVSFLLTKATVRLTARDADNGWDNAFAYTVTLFFLALPLSWMFKAGWIASLFAPVVLWIIQTCALRVIYDVGYFRAWIIGVTHAVALTVVTTTLTLTTAVVVAYIMYGRIISDPWILIRLFLRWIGIIV